MEEKLPFPIEYMMRGNYKLHSGGNSDIFYDVERAITDPIYLSDLLARIPPSDHYVGILTGGALIAMAIRVKHSDSKFSYIKGKELIGSKPDGPWTLIDDVVTTGRSLLEAISLIGNQPEKIFVALDRREKNENPVVESIFEI